MPPASSHPLWRNIVIRTVLYYAVVGSVAYAMRRYTPAEWGALGVESFQELVGGAPSLSPTTATLPTALAATVAMLTAFATSLPVAWIYTATRRKKGFQQSVVQTYLILPVVAAGIVITVKHSLQLAFALAGIVAAVRFRTTLDDSKDAAGIFVVIGIGMAAAVAPSVSWVISIGFNILMLILWWTDFGRPPAVEGKRAEQHLEWAREISNKTGTFVARMDKEILKSLSPEQLEALANRAWARRKSNDPSMAKDASVPETIPTFERLLRVRTVDAEAARKLVEEHCDSLFADWRYIGSETENGVRVIEYGVNLAETVTAGVVTDTFAGIPDSPLRGTELR